MLVGSTTDLPFVGKLVGAMLPVSTLTEEIRVEGMLIDVMSRVGLLNVETLMEGLVFDGMLIDGMLNVGKPEGLFVGVPIEGTLFEGMPNDGLLTVEPPIKGRLLEGVFNVGLLIEGYARFGVLTGGKPSVRMLAVAVWRPLKSKARDNDTHKRSIESR